MKYFFQLLAIFFLISCSSFPKAENLNISNDMKLKIVSTIETQYMLCKPKIAVLRKCKNRDFGISDNETCILAFHKGDNINSASNLFYSLGVFDGKVKIYNKLGLAEDEGKIVPITIISGCGGRSRD